MKSRRRLSTINLNKIPLNSQVYSLVSRVYGLIIKIDEGTDEVSIQWNITPDPITVCLSKDKLSSVVIV